MNILFQREKLAFLSKKDKSSKRVIDGAILPLIKKINSKKDYYTTSSCAGRILLLKEKEKKQKDIFLFVTHEKISFKELRRALDNISYKNLVYFKQEPCILHVACSSLKNAELLVKKARNCGWKKSGIVIGRKIICQLISTEYITLPIMLNNKLLVNDAYLKLLVKEANKKLMRTREKIKKLEKII